jgi:phosphate starvation-inducible PhoH-like protein
LKLENLGFLGDMKEKLDPYMQPLYDALRDMLPNEKIEDYILKGIIQSLGFYAWKNLG